MDLNRIIQALKGTIDPKLRIAAENELNQVRSGPSAASPGSPSSAPLISTPTRAPTRDPGPRISTRLSAGSVPAPAAGSGGTYSLDLFSTAHAPVGHLCIFPCRFSSQCSLFSSPGPQKEALASFASVFGM